MQTPKTRPGSLEVPQRTSPVTPRTARKLKVTGAETDSASSHSASRTPKDKMLQIAERRSPRSPITEKKRPSKLSELESQVAQLQEDLKAAKSQLGSSESGKIVAQQEAEETKKQLVELNAKLEESQRQLLELSASEEVRLQELRKVSQEHAEALKSELEMVQNKESVDSKSLASALSEIESLKMQLEMPANSVTTQSEDIEATSEAEISTLKLDLAKALACVENLNTQLQDCKVSEAQAQELINKTSVQFETVKATAETFRSDGLKLVEAYNSLSSELEKSKVKVTSLEELVSKLKLDLVNTSRRHSGDDQQTPEIEKQGEMKEELEKVKLELNAVKLEAEQLESALEANEIKFQEEHIRTSTEIHTAYELVEHIKTEASQREAELEAELKETRTHIDELRASLMDKETELQSISEENEGLNRRIMNSSTHIQSELETKLKKSNEDFADLKSCLMDKETELQSILEENENLKSEVKRKELETGKANEIVAEIEAAKAAEQEALKKLGYAKLEVDESSRRAARVSEQLEAAQASNSEMEAELRRLKVQSEQWRKAAEAAAAVLSTGNNGRYMERSGSMDSNFHPVTGKLSSPYSDMDDESPKKKNGNMLKKIGVLWKKGQK